jgi:acyl-CoA reductase-like NAD-dependent aldehyde dehydrogenase
MSNSGASGAAAAETVDVASLDHRLQSLAIARDTWSRYDAAQRANILDAVLVAISEAAPAWLEASCAAKGIEPASTASGEELLSGIGALVRLATSLRTSLRSIAKTGRPGYPGPLRHHSQDRISLGVLPASMLDRVIFTGTTAEVWFESGVSEVQVRSEQACAYSPTAPQPQCCLVLAAGNVASLGPRDALDKLFVTGDVVLMKSNPVNEYLVPHWERALAPLIDIGVLHIVRGGPQTGAYLTNHPLVESIHITGSDKTYDAIVFGADAEASARKAQRSPLLDKPITAELGNVSPIVIVPGAWRASELRYQAEHLATMLTNNAGFNCLTPRVVITHRDWPQREAFFAALNDVLASLPSRRAYYPGARERWEQFVSTGSSDQRGAATDNQLPWTILRDVPSSDRDARAFTTEAFCSLMSETALDAPTTAAFIDGAVAFCNDVVWGTLSMTMLVDPRTAKEPPVAAALTRALEDLRYGTIGLNVWHAMGFLGGTTTWGAYPGHQMSDIQSGVGVVGNAFMFQNVQKTVVRGPFVARPRPAWFATNRHGWPVLEQLFRVQCTEQWRYVPRLLMWAMRR